MSFVVEPRKVVAPIPVPVVSHSVQVPPSGGDSIPATPPRPPSVVSPYSKGLTNGRGAVNGTGMVNGRGAINGTGVVNGTGITNGTGLPKSLTPRKAARSSIMTRWQFLAVFAAVLIVIPVFVFLAYSRPAGLSVDGEFGDWAKTEMFGMQVTSTVPEISVHEWAVQNQGNALYFYVGAESTMMSSTSVDSFYLFIDSDDSPDTGYAVSGIGADFLVELHGWDGTVQSATMMEYSSSLDQFDWNNWESGGSATASLSGDRFEAMANLPIALDYAARYLLLAQTNLPDPSLSVSYPVPAEGGLLIARLDQGTSIYEGFGIVPSEPGVHFARLVLTSVGSSGTITRIAPTVLGAALDSSYGTISLNTGQQTTLDVLVDSSLAATSGLISVTIDESSFSSTFSAIDVVSDTVSAYVASAPSSIEIDGAFGDWSGRLKADTDVAPVSNPDIDLTATALANDTSSSSFYVSVQGDIFQGAYAPSTKSKPSGGGGGGGTVIPSRKTGEDVLRIFIDSDLVNTTGLLVTRSNKTVGADYLIEIQGINGRIVSQVLKVYGTSGWVQTNGEISSAKDRQRLELSLSSTSMGGRMALACIIETTDWKDRSDWAWAAIAPDPWVITGPGVTYQSGDGAIWNYLATAALQSGDHIVDIAMTTDDGIVVIVTNTGRTYYWDLASTATNWTAGETKPIDTANYSEAVSMTFFSKTGAWLLTKNGSYFYLMDAISPPTNKEWTYQDLAGSGITDFTDLNYEGGTMYALRSGANTGLSYSNNGNLFISVTAPTGSNSTQSEFAYIPGGPGAADDRIFVLCENGNINYSANGGVNWSTWGNLPRPTGGNTSKYVGLGIDSTGYMWVITDTGYCFRSADSTTYAVFNYTGRAPTVGIVAVIPLPLVPPGIPEFQYMLVPVIGTMLIVLSRKVRAARRKTT